MTPISASIFSLFGALWVGFAIFSQRTPHLLLLLIPVVIAALLMSWARVVAKQWLPVGAAEERRRNKIMIHATTFEGVAILIGVNVLRNLGISDQYLPLTALIVGLHFLPFARFIPERRYYLLAGVLIALAAAGACVPSPDIRAWFVGLSSAAVLWAAAAAALRACSPPRANT